MPKERFSDSPLDPYTNKRPPAVCPSMPRAVAQAQWSLLRLERRQLADNSDGVITPPPVDLTPQHKQTGLRGGVHVCVPAAFGGDGLLQDSTVGGGSRGARGTIARVDTDNRDITKQRDTPAGPDGARTGGCHNVHPPLVVGARTEMRVPKQPFRPNPVTGFTEDLAPWLRGGGMTAMDAASACAC